MTFIGLCYSSIHSIPSEAFNYFRTESNETLTIVIDGFLFNGTNIDTNALQNIGRPTVLRYNCFQISCQRYYLEQKIFQNFLNSNINNKIEPQANSHLLIDCNDCRSYWITKNTKLIDRIEGLNCTNGKQLMDIENFQNCT